MIAPIVPPAAAGVVAVGVQVPTPRPTVRPREDPPTAAIVIGRIVRPRRVGDVPAAPGRASIHHVLETLRNLDGLGRGIGLHIHIDFVVLGESPNNVTAGAVARASHLGQKHVQLDLRLLIGSEHLSRGPSACDVVGVRSAGRDGVGRRLRLIAVRLRAVGKRAVVRRLAASAVFQGIEPRRT